MFIQRIRFTIVNYIHKAFAFLKILSCRRIIKMDLTEGSRYLIVYWGLNYAEVESIARAIRRWFNHGEADEVWFMLLPVDGDVDMIEIGGDDVLREYALARGSAMSSRGHRQC